MSKGTDVAAAVRVRRRRPHRTGSLYRRGDGRWVVSLSLGRDLRGRRLRSKPIYTASETEARKILEHLLGKKALGHVQRGIAMTFGDLLSEWLRRYVDMPAYVTYEVIVRKVLAIKWLADRRLDAVTHRDIDAYIAIQKAAHASPTYQDHQRSILSTALRYAQGQHGLLVNPGKPPVRPPRRGNTGRLPLDARVLLPVQLRELLRVVARSPYRIAFELAGIAGLREGEIFGLRWEHVDLRHGVIHVREQVQWDRAPLLAPDGTPLSTGRRRVGRGGTGEHWVWRAPKWDGFRQIELSRYLKERLEAEFERFLQRQCVDPTWNQHCLVMPGPQGRPMHGSYFVEHVFHPALLNTGLPAHSRSNLNGCRFHDLRHTCASILAARGSPLVNIKAQLGHKSLRTTEKYLHVYASAAQREARAMNDLFG